MTDVTKKEIKGIEFKHGIYRQAGKTDIVFIKERVHFTDGSTEPRTRIAENYKREFYVTKPGFRKHEQKKTTECLDRLQKFTCTQSTLIDAIGKALGRPGFNGNLRMICKSPYVYGADVTTPVLLKQRYRETYPDCISLNIVAAMDTETDVITGTDEIDIISLTYKDKAIIAVTKRYLGSHPNPKEDFYEKLGRYLGDHVKARNINVEFYIGNTPGDICAEVMSYAHKWKPDFITFWNIAFDMPRIIDALEKGGYDVGHVFSDPSVPTQFRTASWRPASPQKVTASGKVTAPHPADLWHTMDCAASFYFIDSMCLYKKVRVAAGNEASYSLDYILKKVLNITKLKFDAVKHAEGTLQWHEIMQRDYKIEYMVYNLFDNIAVEILDEEIKDIAATISVLNGSSEYARFPSQPRRLVDGLHFFLLDHNPPYVVGTTSSDMVEELDSDVVEMTDWIKKGITQVYHSYIMNV